jgi:dienelactone hydrolase
MKWITLALFLLPVLSMASEPVEYRDGETVLEGSIAYPKDKEGKLPVVLIVHDWNGIDSYEQGRADQIAGLGYIGFAIDIYGKDIRPKNAQESGAEAGKYYQNHDLLRSRVKAALDYIATNPRADTKRMVMIGYCFGGMVALDTARSGADLLGVVSFHGGLKASFPAKPHTIKAKILVLHGDADIPSPMKDVEALKKEMSEAKADCRVVIYKGAKHAFTVPGPDSNIPGVGYDEKADKASWKEMVSFLAKLFKHR